MIGKRLQEWGRSVGQWVARIFVRTPITPNMLTLFGLVLNIVVAVLLAYNHLLSGGVMMVVAGLFDVLDGALAKITNKTSTFGAFLDSVVDRYSESIVLLGLLLYYLQRSPLPEVEIVLIFVILFGSMQISYTRARAGSLKISNEGGLLARPERVILLAIGLLVHTYLLVPVLWILAIGTQITALQRVVRVWQATMQMGEKPGE